ncbi:hypothetical protein Emag_006810 [Eimeria magna]
MTPVEAQGNRDVGESAHGSKGDPSEGNAPRLTQDVIASEKSGAEGLFQERCLAEGRDKEADQLEDNTLGRRALQAAISSKRRSTRRKGEDEKVGYTEDDENLDGGPADSPDGRVADSSASEGNAGVAVQHVNLVDDFGTEAEVVITDGAAPTLRENRDTENPDLSDKPEALILARSVQSASGNSNASARRRIISQTSAGMHSRHSNASDRPPWIHSCEGQSSTRSVIEQGFSQNEQAGKANNAVAHIWEMSEESSQDQQDASDEAAEDNRRDRSRETARSSLDKSLYS